MARFTRTAIMLLAGILVSFAVGCAGQRAEDEEGSRLMVVVSIAPLADFARNVGGDRVEVVMLVSPGVSPHAFEPTPRQLKVLSRAAVLVLNGVGLELWAHDLVAAAQNPRLRVVHAAEGLDIIGAAKGGHQGNVGNPHVWLAPVCAIHQVEQITEALIEVDPAGAGTYRENAEVYIGELRQLDAEARRTVGAFSRKRFVAQHGVWSYFAREYGLAEVGVIETTPGDEPSPRELSDLVETMRRQQVTAIFVEPQLSQKAARVIAAETGAAIVELDPLGNPAVRGYLDTMRTNLEKMARALR